MRIDILTLIPGVFDGVFDESILGAARRSGLIDIRVHGFREHGEGRHQTVDDTPFGGGPGMLLKPGPLAAAIRAIREDGPAATVVGLTPQGLPFTQDLAKELAALDRIVLVCGRYEGFDERILPQFDVQVSVGDYVLTGGEFAAMTLVDAISRMIPGTVGREASVMEDSFYDGALDHPQYTRPAVWEDRFLPRAGAPGSNSGRSVPRILREGHHARITAWRRGEALKRTAVRRPDLFRRLPLGPADRDALQHSIRPAATAAGGPDPLTT